MSLTHEMIKENVFNWLDALVVGAKAVTQTVQCGIYDDDDAVWAGEAFCFEKDSFLEDDGSPCVLIHRIKNVAQAVEFDLHHRLFTPADSHYAYFVGEYFFIYNGVKFANVYGTFSDEVKERRKNERVEYQRKQSGDSGASENVPVDNE